MYITLDSFKEKVLVTIKGFFSTFLKVTFLRGQE